MANRPALSDAEREVLKVLWDHGPGTVREINEVLEASGPALGLHDGGDAASAAGRSRSTPSAIRRRFHTSIGRW